MSWMNNNSIDVQSSDTVKYEKWNMKKHWQEKQSITVYVCVLCFLCFVSLVMYHWLVVSSDG